MKRLIRRKPILIPLLILLGIGAFALFGWVVMALWNAVMVPVLGVNVISFWQAFGLLILSRILVGGFGGSHGRRRGNWQQKWEGMSPEERERIRSRWKHHFDEGHTDTDDTSPEPKG